jgi:hypothetical protein
MFARSSIAIQYHRSLWLSLILCGKVDINGKKTFYTSIPTPTFLAEKKKKKLNLIISMEAKNI